MCTQVSTGKRELCATGHSSGGPAGELRGPHTQPEDDTRQDPSWLTLVVHALSTSARVHFRTGKGGRGTVNLAMVAALTSVDGPQKLPVVGRPGPTYIPVVIHDVP